MKLNVSATKRHALVCSEKLRAGKFKRVGEDFVQQIEGVLDSTLRMLSHSVPNETLSTEEYFFTPEGERAILAALSTHLGKSIQKRVQAHPSLGKTLKA